MEAQRIYIAGITYGRHQEENEMCVICEQMYASRKQMFISEILALSIAFPFELRLFGNTIIHFFIRNQIQVNTRLDSVFQFCVTANQRKNNYQFITVVQATENIPQNLPIIHGDSQTIKKRILQRDMFSYALK